MTTALIRSGNHKWGGKVYIAARESPDGNERQEKTCALCKVARITVIPPFGRPWHEWRHPSGEIFQMEARPSCDAVTESQ